jgi:iron complex outermembrane receptor protein
MPYFLTTLLVSTCMGAMALADPVNPGMNMEDLYNLPVEQLAGLEYTVTSASKREEKLLDTAAAVYVVSAEDIRRSGATSIPEALRGVPGLDVARVNDHSWAISSRGFNDPFSNKLLVMIDGRSIYTPEFSGVYWDEQNIPLENVERIEVVRGPGATLWGANAVNGVINIITKSAKDMQGNLASAGTGTIETGFGTARHGGKFAENGFYDVYATTDNNADHAPFNGTSRDFDYNMERAGFRTDWSANKSDKVMVEGDLFHGNEHDLNINNPFNASSFMSGGDVVGKWTHDYSAASKLQVESYIDSEDRLFDSITARSVTYDADVQHTYTGFERHEIVWGAGARFIDLFTSGNADYPYPVTSSYSDRLLHVFNTFFQDQYALIPGKWFLIGGTKLEDNSYTGVEWEPSIRTLWKIDPTQSAWAGITRAVRTPSAFENNFDITIGPIRPGALAPLPTLVPVQGESTIESEQVFTYEVGYRKEISKKASIDTTAFYNYYGNIVSNQVQQPFLDGFTVVIPQTFTNEYHAQSYGVEIAPSWQVTDNWKLKGSYSMLETSYMANEANEAYEYTKNSFPRNQFSVTSYLNLPHYVELDGTFSYTDPLSDLKVPAHVSLDMRVGWKPLETDALELSLSGQNLFNREHVEFNTLIDQQPQTAIPIPQDIVAKVTARF